MELYRIEYKRLGPLGHLQESKEEIFMTKEGAIIRAKKLKANVFEDGGREFVSINVWELSEHMRPLFINWW